MLMELELIEPELFRGNASRAAGRVATAIMTSLYPASGWPIDPGFAP